MIARLQNLEVTMGKLRLRSCDRMLMRRGPVECVAVEKLHDDGLCHVVAVIELSKDDEDPTVRFVGMRPFDEDRDDFWELTRLGCNLVKGIRPMVSNSEAGPR